MDELVDELVVAADGRRLRFPPGRPVVLGRGPECQVVLTDTRVSRRHLEVTCQPGGWYVRDLASANGTYCDQQRLVSQPVGAALALRLGHHQDGPLVELSTAPVPAEPPPAAPVPAGPARAVTIGREADNHIVLTDLLVSRHHARLDPTRYGYQVLDLGSSNRTFVNGVPVARAPLQEGDLLTVGRTRFTLRGGELQPVADEPVAELSVESLSYRLPDGRALINDVSLQVAGPRLVAVLGPSGAGKSTLFRLLCGELVPSAGQVRYQDVDVHTHYAEIKSRIGVVPQHTIAHQRLTARQALRYAAELRLSGDASRPERDRRVQQVLDDLGLAAHARTRVDRLSGGQQRRLSIGFELLTRTSLLMLDEPTSGLDPALAFDVMRLLRRLADDGRQVLVTTHDTNHLDQCDSVVILAAGGQLVYAGPPDGITAHFGTDHWPEIFARLAVPPPPPPAPYPQPAAAAQPPAGALPPTWALPPTGGMPPVRSVPPTRPVPLAGAAAAAGRVAGQPVASQLWVLLRRQFRLLAADRGYLTFLALLPVALTALALAVPGSDGLGPPTGVPDAEPMWLLVVLIIGATFTGMAASVRDLVGERPIYRHERSAGLNPEAYLLSKLCFFATVTVAQSLLLVGGVRLFRPGPQAAVLSVSGTLEVAAAVAATAVACTTLGLLVSALMTTVEQTTPPLVVAVMTQLVLCGGVIPLAGRAFLEQLSWLTPARWGYASAAATVDLTRVVPGAPDDVLWSHHPVAWLSGLTAMLLLAAAFALLTLRLLRRR